jgi:hypothetical protein
MSMDMDTGKENLFMQRLAKRIDDANRLLAARQRSLHHLKVAR